MMDGMPRRERARLPVFVLGWYSSLCDYMSTLTADSVNEMLMKVLAQS